MSKLKPRLLNLPLYYCILCCFALMSPLSAFDCGCAGSCDYDCECGPDCACEADYADDCDNDCDEDCDECDAYCDEDDCDPCGYDDCYASCMPCDCYIDGFSVGIDYLYWKPCISGLHYAVKGTNAVTASTNNLGYKYLDPSFESGFRVNFASQFTIEGLSFRATYTDLGYEDEDCVATQTANAIQLSHAQPFAVQLVNGVSADWEMKYQTVEAVLAYKLDMDSLVFSPYAGVDVMMLDHKIKAIGTDSLSETVTTVRVRKHQQYFGAGPMLGMGTVVAFSDCLNFFFDANASLFIGGAEERDKFTIVDDGTTTQDRRFKSNECYCFPGWHLMFGLGYETCLCGLDVGLRFGYEFVQYTNAPSFLDYEQDEDGIVSAVNSSNLTFRGLFVGLNVGF